MKIIKILILITAVVAVFFSKEDLVSLYAGFSLKLPQVEKGISELVQETGKQIFTPPPLYAEKEAQEALLTQEGVISLTNTERAKLGLPALKESLILDVSAAAKVADMFKNQYFAHEAPSGVNVSDLAENAGYDFIIIGENLALGNFENDEALVQAWMDSPGHRANILNENYQEIGVSVQKGVFDGKTTWLAVQHFGKPISACPQPSEPLKEEIELSQSQLTELQNNLELLRSELEAINRKNREDYRQKVEQYNNLVSQYNNLVAETKSLVDTYNEQVKTFNACASGI